MKSYHNDIICLIRMILVFIDFYKTSSNFTMEHEKQPEVYNRLIYNWS